MRYDFIFGIDDVRRIAPGMGLDTGDLVGGCDDRRQRLLRDERRGWATPAEWAAALAERTGAPQGGSVRAGSARFYWWAAGGRMGCGRSVGRLSRL